jgi:hypothetical protein
MLRDQFSLGMFGVVLLVCAAVPGCSQGPPTGTLQGKVTLKGEPFANARLNFLNQKTGAAIAGEIQTDGSYRVDKIEAGTYTVFLTPKEVGDPDNPSAGSGIDPNVPPDCYNQNTSPLRVEVKPGANTANIELSP